MAEEQAKESTLKRVSDQLMIVNVELAKTPEELAALKELYGIGVKEAKKTRSDLGKHHKKREKSDKEADKDRGETHKKLGFMGNLLLAGKKLAMEQYMRNEKLAKLLRGSELQKEALRDCL